MKLSPRTLLYAIPLVIFLSGCSTISVNWDFDPSADFYRLASYDWMDPDDTSTNHLRAYDSLTHSRVLSAIEDQLFIKGYIKQVGGTPDFLVAYHAAVEGKLDTTVIDTHYGYAAPSAWGYQMRPASYREVRAYAYEEGTLVIDVIDPKTSQLIWRGSAQAEVNRSANPTQKEKRVREAVGKILANFPPQ